MLFTELKCESEFNYYLCLIYKRMGALSLKRRYVRAHVCMFDQRFLEKCLTVLMTFRLFDFTRFALSHEIRNG